MTASSSAPILRSEEVRMDTAAYFQSCLADAVAEFFRDYGIACSASDPPPSSAPASETQAEIGSMVGFRGEHVRGGLALLAPVALVAATLPVPSDPRRLDGQLRDWSGEMTNQLLGRLKNKLSLRFLDFEVGTAASFRGVSFRVSLRPSPDGISLVCRVASTGARIYLDCSHVQLLPPREDTHAPPLGEGDVLVF